MRVRVLRSLGSALVTELSKAEMVCPLAQENEEIDVSDKVAKLLIEQKLAEICGKKEEVKK